MSKRISFVKIIAVMLTAAVSMTGFAYIPVQAAEAKQEAEAVTEQTTETVTESATETEEVTETETETGTVEEKSTEAEPKPEPETEAQTEKVEKPKMQSRAAIRSAVGNLDIVNGKAVRMPRTSTGVVVDGYQLDHDYVKILNINNGAITIRDEDYTQGAETGSWTTQEDAYVIKGKGSSTNDITITPTKNEITVYLVDLEWNGQIVISGNACKVNIVICGTVQNWNSSNFIYHARYYGDLFIKGLNGKEDTVNTNRFIKSNFSSSIGALYRVCHFSDMTINATLLLTKWYDNDVYCDQEVIFDNVAINTTGSYNFKCFRSITVNNSILRLDLKATNVNSSNSVIHFVNPVIGDMKSTNSSLFLDSPAASTFSLINLLNSSLYSAVPFGGTPVDDNTNDLYLKKIRLRQFPNTFVYVTINGQEARLQTDANGFLYPYVKTGTTRVDARLEDGRTYYATFPATTGADDSTTNLIQSAESVPVIVSCSGAQNVTVGAQLSLYVEANPGTTGKALSYQWFKNEQPIAGATQAAFTKNEATTGDSGTYKCTVKEDGGGTTASENIEVVVGKAVSPNVPIISSMTSDMDLIAGSSVQVTVNAVPSIATNALSYQWFLNGTPVGTNSNKLTLTNIQSGQQGNYKCVITEENSNTTAESGIIKITVR